MAVRMALRARSRAHHSRQTQPTAPDPSKKPILREQLIGRWAGRTWEERNPDYPERTRYAITCGSYGRWGIAQNIYFEIEEGGFYAADPNREKIPGDPRESRNYTACSIRLVDADRIERRFPLSAAINTERRVDDGYSMPLSPPETRHSQPDSKRA
jgi:hypothetical protein